jgi:hypothetical protein
MADPAYRVFLSHSRKDKGFERELYRRLTRDGVSCFFDIESIGWGQNWVRALKFVRAGCGARALTATRRLWIHSSVLEARAGALVVRNRWPSIGNSRVARHFRYASGLARRLRRLSSDAADACRDAGIARCHGFDAWQKWRPAQPCEIGFYKGRFFGVAE